MSAERRAPALSTSLTQARVTRRSLTRPKTVVIVGAGLAGFRAAERLREREFNGRIVIVGEEPHRPYNRTHLSKQMLAGPGRLDDLRLTSYRRLDAIWRLGRRAASIDPARQILTLADGEELRYDGLIAATGVAPRFLAGSPMSSQYVWALRDLRDGGAGGRRGHPRAPPNVVVGSGFIGCEVAASLRARGLQVSLVGRGDYLLGGAVGRMVGDVVTDLHHHHGVQLHLGRRPVAWDAADVAESSGHRDRAPRRGRIYRRGRAPVRMLLDDGTQISADLAVVAIGAVPAIDWLRGSGLDHSDGLLTGPTTHAVGPGGPIDSIVAAGDMARWPNLLFDATPRRVEHWITAAEHGQAAADALLQGPYAAQPFMPLPRFWTEQHHVRIQSVGRPALADDCAITEGSIRSMSFVACYTRAGVVVGAVAFNASRELLDYANLIGLSPSGQIPAAPGTLAIGAG
ncbi:MAG: NAD(P)/FAD-dependent oxidoreductase [Frankia sp.]